MKTINDSFGHLFGDTVLQNIANIIQTKISDNDLFARWGGDEFAMLLPQKTLEESMILIDEIKKGISDFHFTDSLNISCSFGLVEMNSDSTFEEMLKEADKLMYSGKKLGKNSVYTNKMCN